MSTSSHVSAETERSLARYLIERLVFLSLSFGTGSFSVAQAGLEPTLASTVL